MTTGSTAGVDQRRGELPPDQAGPRRAASAGGEVRAVGVQEQVQRRRQEEEEGQRRGRGRGRR